MTYVSPRRPTDEASRRPQVAVVGSVNLDLIVSVPHLPAAGETILGSDLAYRAGGKGGNQAVAAHRLGAHATLIAATGDDRLGVDLREALAGEGLDLSYARITENMPTGVALIVVAEDGENSIVVSPGANSTLDPLDVSDLDDVLARVDVLVLQAEVPLAASYEAAVRARNNGSTVVLNAAPLPNLPDPEFEKLLGTVDVLVVNELEASQLLGGEPAASNGRLQATDLAGWAAVAARLCETGPASAIITLGARGAVAGDSERYYVQDAFPVQVVDTTGAGDAFSGALAVSLAEGRTMTEALRRACAAGAMATTKLGAQAALPTIEQVEELIAAQMGDLDA